MSSILVQRQKRQHAGGIVEVNIWLLSSPIPPCTHRYKYRLVYVVNGIRVVGYDNERGKGDHRHVGKKQYPYAFVDLLTLRADFWHDVSRKGKSNET